MSQARLPITIRTTAGSLSAWAWIRMTRNTGVAYAARVTAAGLTAARKTHTLATTQLRKMVNRSQRVAIVSINAHHLRAQATMHLI
jgi:hypothetical protein